MRKSPAARSVAELREVGDVRVEAATQHLPVVARHADLVAVAVVHPHPVAAEPLRPEGPERVRRAQPRPHQPPDVVAAGGLERRPEQRVAVGAVVVGRARRPGRSPRRRRRSRTGARRPARWRRSRPRGRRPAVDVVADAPAVGEQLPDGVRVLGRHRRHPVAGGVVELELAPLDHPERQHAGDRLADRGDVAGVRGVEPDAVGGLPEPADVERDAVVVDGHAHAGEVDGVEPLGDPLVERRAPRPVRALGVLPPDAGVPHAVAGRVAVEADEPVAEVAVAVPVVAEGAGRQVTPRRPAASGVVGDEDPGVALPGTGAQRVERQHAVAAGELVEPVRPRGLRQPAHQPPVAVLGGHPDRGVPEVPSSTKVSTSTGISPASR